MARDTFLRGAFILTLAGLSVKVIGSVSRILLSRFLGGEGIGLYQMAYPIYLLLASLSSAGIPVAISIIISERIALGDLKGAKKVFKVSFLAMCLLGLCASILLYFAAAWLIENQFVRDSRAYYALLALAPAVFFATILASFRGYFQGFQQMLPTAVSQIVEQFVRVVAMIVLAYYFMRYGLGYAAAGATFGAVPGAAAGLIVLCFFYWRQKMPTMEAQTCDENELSTGKLIKKLVHIALPVCLANAVVPLISSIDALLVPARLEVAGYSVEQSTTLFGYLAGMALPLLTMATIPTTSLALSLVPAVSEAFTLNDKQSLYYRISTAVRLTGIITVPCFFGIAVIAKPISSLLYGTPLAAGAIAVTSFGIFFLGLHQITTAMLQGINKASIPMINIVISAFVKIAMVWFLTSIPSIGIIGAAWATVADFALACILNLYFVHRYTGFWLNFSDLAKVFTCGAVMAACTHFLYAFCINVVKSNAISTLVAICISALIYFAMLLILNCITKEELGKIPVMGSILLKIKQKISLVKDNDK